MLGDFQDFKDKNSGQKTTYTNIFGKYIVESSCEIIVTQRNVQSGLTWKFLAWVTKRTRPKS